MATINQVEKIDYSAQKIDYTSKDYVAILDDLINSIPGITQKWNSTDQNDPGMILVKLMSIIGDMLFFNQDMQSLEVYPNSVTLRKNAASIYKLIGYKMRWYKSATLEANVINTFSNSATLPRFCTFKTDTGITYTTFDQYELPSNMTNNGTETLVELVQGTPVTPVRTSSSPYPEAGRSWHSIYGYNYTTDDIINNRIYLKDNNIDQSHIILVDDQNEVWELRENIYLTTDVGRFFEFGVDVNDDVYIELVDYYTNFNINKFKIFYIKSDGESGQIYANTLKAITGNVWSRQGSDQNIYNVSSFIHFTHYDSTLGYNPETPDEARKNSVKYQNTMDTLITLADFERAVLREPGVANVRATDLTNDPGEPIEFSVGNINMDYTQSMEDGVTLRSEIIDQADYDLLSNYLTDKSKYPLTTYQLKLADCNQDGEVNEDDLKCLEYYIKGDPADIDKTGYIGIQKIKDIEMLNGFTVKLYILRNDIGEQMNEESFESMILSDLEDYKILPLSLKVDINSINKYYWTITGSFFTKQPLSRDELQSIIVRINNQLRFQYSVEKVNFNTLINYKEIIETILSVDSRILMVDLDPIVYKDYEGNEISKAELTGNYTYTEPQLNNKNDEQNLHYHFIIPGTPILPGSVMLKINNGQYTLRDNNNGHIYNVDNILTKKGDIDYITGEVDLQFNAPLTDDIVINFIHNATNIAVYKNLNTQTFYFDQSSLEKDDMQDMV
jgi:hypothetical protein